MLGLKIFYYSMHYTILCHAASIIPHTFSLSLSPLLQSFCLCLFLSLHHSLSFSLSLALSISLFFYLYISISLSVSDSHSFYLSISISPSLSLFLSPSLSLSLTHSISSSPSLSLYVFHFQIGALANVGLATSKGLIGYSVNSTGRYIGFVCVLSNSIQFQDSWCYTVSYHTASCLVVSSKRNHFFESYRDNHDESFCN